MRSMRGCLRSIRSVNRLTAGVSPDAGVGWTGMSIRVLLRQGVSGACGGRGVRAGGHCCDEIASAGPRTRGVRVRLTGIDLNARCGAGGEGSEATMPGTVTFLAGNAYGFQPPEGIDLVISSLMTHHMQNGEVVEFLRWMEATARMGWFVNDLHRQKVPYYAFRALTRFTRWHPFVKHDGPVSILRSFRREDWLELCRDAGIPERAYSIREYRPARLCVARLR